MNQKMGTFGGLALAFLVGPTFAYASGEIPTSFTLEGQLYSSPTGTSPLLDSGATVRVQILNPAKTCVLYDEAQTVDTSTSQGLFNIQIGSATGAAKRTGGSDPGNSMVTVFQNVSTMPATGCAGSAYAPSAGDVRYLRIIVTPTAGAPETLSPDISLGNVPMALVAERAENLQGLGKSGFVQTDSASLTQANVANIFSNTNYPLLTALIGGTSSQYVTKSTSGGSALPTVAGTPASPSAGSMWYNSSNNTVQYYDGTTTQTIGTGSGAGTITGVTAGTGLSGGGTTGGVTLNLANTAVSAGSYGSATQVPTFTVDAQGRLTAASNTTISGVAPAGTAGGDLSGSYPNPSVAKIAGVAVSAPTSAGQVLRYDGTNITPAFVAMTDLRSKVTGTQALSATCTAAKTLTYDSSTDSLACTDIAIANTQVSGLGTAATLNVGTGNNNIVQLDGSAKLPAVDGSALTNVAATGISGGRLTLTPSAATSGSPSILKLTGAADTTLTASTEASDAYFNLARIVQFATGALATQRAVNVQAPTYAFVGASTITNAATLGLSGPPNGGTNATLTNSSALYIPTAALTNVTNGYGLNVTAPTGATNNYAATFSGNVGVGTSSPRSALDVNGTIIGKPSTSNATTTIDFSTGNIQYTTGNCGAYTLYNLKDGGTYSFIVKGATAATCTFTGYSDSGTTGITMHMPPDNANSVANKHTIYNIMVGGTDAYVAWTPGY